MDQFEFTIKNDECPYCYPDEGYWCSNIQMRCNKDQCPFMIDQELVEEDE